MRRVARRAEPAAATARGVPAVSWRAARVPHVHRVRHACRQALPRADRGGSERQDARELLRPLQAARRGVYATQHGRGRQGADGTGEIVRQALIALTSRRPETASCRSRRHFGLNWLHNRRSRRRQRHTQGVIMFGLAPLGPHCPFGFAVLAVAALPAWAAGAAPPMAVASKELHAWEAGDD